jgi:hypothetical protein
LSVAPTLPFGVVLTASSARCRTGRTVAGGFRGSEPDVDVSIALITDSFLRRGVWRVSSAGDGGDGPVSLRAQGICP